jgi:FACT complex subunit SPT16
MAEIKIDSKLFQERISHVATAWKNDLRASHGLFNDAASILIMMGKVEEVPELHKNNAVHVSSASFPRFSPPSTLLPARPGRGSCARHVSLTRASQFWLLGYEFPTTLMLLTTDSIYIVTTAKKGETASADTPDPTSCD